MTSFRKGPRRWPYNYVLAAAFAAALLILISATQRPGPAPVSDDQGAASQPQGSRDQGSASQPQGDSDSACPAKPPTAAEGPSAETIVLNEDPRVEAVVYPHPDHAGNPWSQWGQGLVLSDGRFISAIGDHLGADGNSYVYEFEPGSSRLTQIGDVDSAVNHQPGAWGYGKIHAPIVAGDCGEVYLSTYNGSTKGMTYGNGYDGDLLLRLDTSTRRLTPIATPAPRHGIPSLAGSGAPKGLLYGEAVDPKSNPDTGAFFVYDPASGKVVFEDEALPHAGFRSVMVDAKGRAYIAAGDGKLNVYDPADNRLTTHGEKLPGDWLRASTKPAPDGTVYGATRDPDALFALRPDGSIDSLGDARGYVASLAVDPKGEYLYYVPDAHGTSWKDGSPLVRVNADSGKDKVVVKLNDMAEQRLGLRLGGSYDIAMDLSGNRIYIGMNAGRNGETFGEVVLLVVTLP